MSDSSTNHNYTPTLFERVPGRCGRKQVYYGTRLERHFIRQQRQQFGVANVHAWYPQLTEQQIQDA